MSGVWETEREVREGCIPLRFVYLGLVVVLRSTVRRQAAEGIQVHHVRKSDDSPRWFGRKSQDLAMQRLRNNDGYARLVKCGLTWRQGGRARRGSALQM